MQEKNTQTSGGNSEHKRSATECFSTLKERVISKTKRLCHWLAQVTELTDNEQSM